MAIYTTGKGASAIELIATIHKDPVTREWALEGGAFVIADKGICLIDEFDKMNEQGRYDSSKTFSQNVESTNPIISRFDILCVVKDVVDLVKDEMLARFVVDSHFKSQPKGVNIHEKSISNSHDKIETSSMPTDPEILPQDLLKNLTFAKLNVFPSFHDAGLNKLTQVYAELWRESLVRFSFLFFPMFQSICDFIHVIS
ncbi:hypothetical protein TEA_017915 [Camellia sinensis var. sinensis]|uniref:DNA helicase n=1 Tax=Camellia sinensis var. sinensis TaxID=542762 RepID=A0A4S4DIJ0_CAMSN|nr:hypothetical protein TEA_017915 [Camellia sinensis var. sinensis]